MKTARYTERHFQLATRKKQLLVFTGMGMKYDIATLLGQVTASLFFAESAGTGGGGREAERPNIITTSINVFLLLYTQSI